MILMRISSNSPRLNETDNLERDLKNEIALLTLRFIIFVQNLTYLTFHELETQAFTGYYVDNQLN